MKGARAPPLFGLHRGRKPDGILVLAPMSFADGQNLNPADFGASLIDDKLVRCDPCHAAGLFADFFDLVAIVVADGCP